jgi:hypothetical protein
MFVRSAEKVQKTRSTLARDESRPEDRTETKTGETHESETVGRDVGDDCGEGE